MRSLEKITAFIPKRYQRFLKAVDNVRTEAWGTIFVQGLKYNPTYSHLFTISDDKYQKKKFKKSLAYTEAEKNEVKKNREKLNVRV